MEDDKQYNILLVEDSPLAISSIQKDMKLYSKNISLTLMSTLNSENDGNDGYIDENKAILFHDSIDQIWLSIHDILTNNYHLILMDTNMHRCITNSLLELLIQKDFPNPIVSISDSPEQALAYWYEHVEKNKVTKNFKEYIIDPLKSGLFLKQRQESHSSRKNIIEEKKLINQEIVQHISNSLKNIKIRYKIFWKFF